MAAASREPALRAPLAIQLHRAEIKVAQSRIAAGHDYPRKFAPATLGGVPADASFRFMGATGALFNERGRGDLDVPQRDGVLSTAVEAAQDFMAASRSEATLRAYKSDWHDFEKWCDRHCLIMLPADARRRLFVGNGDRAADEVGHHSPPAGHHRIRASVRETRQPCGRPRGPRRPWPGSLEPSARCTARRRR
jgi:hypothetical protein